MQTTQDIIKVLPFQEDFKEDLLNNYDGLTVDQRFAIERILWEFYDALYESRLEENMQKAFERAKQNQEKLDPEFYARVRKETDLQVQQEFSKTETSVDLSDTREELEKILQQSS